MQSIKDTFEAKKKASAVFVHLIATYDTVWHHGLISKMLKLVSDKQMVCKIMQVSRAKALPLPPPITANLAEYNAKK